MPTRRSPFSTRRSVSTCSSGQCDRFASVRLRILPPCRVDSRNKTAGGEVRLGTRSTYMPQDTGTFLRGPGNSFDLHGYVRCRSLSAFYPPVIDPRLNHPPRWGELRSSRTSHTAGRGALATGVGLAAAEREYRRALA